MDLPRILFYTVGRVMTVIMAGIGLGLDYTGGSIANLSPSDLGRIGLIAFGVFLILTVAREIELSLEPRPRVVYDGLSPASTPVRFFTFGKPLEEKNGYFVRLSFKNKAKTPSGVESIAQHMTAFIEVFDAKQNLVDSWEGRWATKNEPHSYGERWEADRMDLAANNQQAILDIGLRYEGQTEFQGWDNGHYVGAMPRRLIQPGCYKLQVTLAASNFKEKEWSFSLEIPEEAQSNAHQVQLKFISH